MTHIGSINITVDTSQVVSATAAITSLGSAATRTQSLLSSLATVNLSPTTTSANTLASSLTGVAAQAARTGAALRQMTQVQKLDVARDILNIRSFHDIQREIDLTRAAYNRLANSGTVSGRELQVANQAHLESIKKLNAEMSGMGNSSGGGGISGLLAQMSGFSPAMLAAGGAVAVVAAAVGSLAVSLYDANNRVQGMMLSFRALGADGGSTLLAYQDAANSMGASFWDSGKAIQSWNASTNGTALEGQRAIEVFNTMSGAVQLFGGGAAEVAGSMRALGQMMNKQQVYSEELVSQLGERFPAALKLAAEATGLTVKQLREALKDGKIASDGFVNSFVNKVDEEYGPAMERMRTTTRGKVNQMKNDWNTLVSAISITVDNVIAEMGRIPGADDLLAASKRVILKQSLEYNATMQGFTKDEQAGKTYDDLTKSGFKVTPAMQAEAQRLANMRRDEAVPARTAMQVAGGTLAVVGTAAATGGLGLFSSPLAYTAGSYAGGKAQDAWTGITTKDAPVTRTDLLMAIGTAITTVPKEQRVIYQNSMNRSADFKGNAEDEANKKATAEQTHKDSVNETARKLRMADALTIADPKKRTAAVNAIKAESIHKTADINGRLALAGLGTELGRELAKTFDIRKADQFFKTPQFAKLPQETQDALRSFDADYKVEKNKTLAPSGGGGKGLTPAQLRDKKGDNFEAGIDKMFDSWTKKADDAENGPLSAAYKGIEQATEAKEKQLATALKFNEITKARHDKELAFLHSEMATAKVKAKIVIDAAEAEKAAKAEQKRIQDEINKAIANRVAMEKQINTSNRATAKELENILTMRRNIVRTIEDEERAKNPMNSKSDLEEIARKQFVESKTNGLRGKVDQARDKENALTADKNPWTMNIAEYNEYQNALGVTETAEKALAEATEIANDTFDRQLAKASSWQLSMSGTANSMIQAMDATKLQSQFASSVVSEFGDTLLTATGTRKDWRNREQHIKDYFASLLSHISKMVIQLGVIKPLMESVFGGADKAGGGGGIGALMNMGQGFIQSWLAPAEGAANFIGPVMPKLQADGGAWSNGVQMYANGGVFGGEHGIYSQPTFFAHAGGLGVLGEKPGESESVMPLKRGKDGKLGVIASGGGGGAQINNFTPSIIIQGNADDEAIAKMTAALRAEFKQHVSQSINKNNVKSQRPGGMNYSR